MPMSNEHGTIYTKHVNSPLQVINTVYSSSYYFSVMSIVVMIVSNTEDYLIVSNQAIYV